MTVKSKIIIILQLLHGLIRNEQQKYLLNLAYYKLFRCLKELSNSFTFWLALFTQTLPNLIEYFLGFTFLCGSIGNIEKAKLFFFLRFFV